jgi:hypothetical protein
MEDERFNISVEDLDEDDEDTKFFVWSRKIEENIEFLEDNNYSETEIRKYLSLCADAREKFLDPNDLTEIEEYYTEKIQPIWKEYGIIDPMTK